MGFILGGDGITRVPDYQTTLRIDIAMPRGCSRLDCPSE